MSRLDQLIKELCPNGVEYRKLKDVFDIRNGYTPSKKNKNYWENGTIPWFRMEDLREQGKIVNDSKQHITSEAVKSSGLFESGSIILATTATVGEHAMLTNDSLANQQFTNFTICKSFKSKLLPKFVFYYFDIIDEWCKKHTKVSSFPAVNIDALKETTIPVPPLPIQDEIVHILDSFTEVKEELITKLSEELEARKKQYEYYRDELLKPKEDIPMVALKDIATSIYRGSGIKRDQVTEEGVPCVRYGEIYTSYNTWFDKCISHTKEEYVSNPKYFEHGDILFAITGESVEDIAKSVAYTGEDKCLAGGDIVVMKHNQNPRYLAHILNTSMAREQKSKGKVKSKVVHSNVSSIEDIKIPLPSLEVQERYAYVLDNFEKICNDLNIGLPAEIEAREKQYEFYRDLLLTFAQTGKIFEEEGRRKKEEGNN
ncbi:MAG: restriction endonuclease subunit S [Finegoldia sp.]|nr:restriction endonuclease subunit S [Finegoldia sp.]